MKGKFSKSLILLCLPPLSCLGALGVATYAWFSSFRSAEANVNSIRVEAPGFDEYGLYCLSINKPAGAEVYSGYPDYASLDDDSKASRISGNGDFIEITDGSEAALMEDMFPLSCFTFALFLGESDFTSFQIGIETSSSPSASNYVEVIRGGQTTYERVVLAGAIDVYSKTIPLAEGEYAPGALNLSESTIAEVNSFITTEMGALGSYPNVTREDRFAFSQSEEQEPVSSSPYRLNRALTDDVITQGADYLVLFTVEFSDLPSTHMSPLIDVEGGIEGASYWRYDESSNLSTAYQGLSFVIDSVSVVGGFLNEGGNI